MYAKISKIRLSFFESACSETWRFTNLSHLIRFLKICPGYNKRESRRLLIIKVTDNVKRYACVVRVLQ